MDSNMTFRLDADVKEQMSSICRELGMTTSTAFNLFARAFVRAKGMPFAVSQQRETEASWIDYFSLSRDKIQQLLPYLPKLYTLIRKFEVRYLEHE